MKSSDDKHCTNKVFNYTDMIFYAASLAVVIFIKIFYDNADNNQLVFILNPLSKIVSMFHGSVFVFEGDLGFVSSQLQIAINKSCAGINFMLIVFAMLSISYIHKFRNVKGKIIYFLFLFPVSYILALLINSFRIIISIIVQRVDFLDGWASPEVTHNLIGMLIFICFLFIINYIFSTILKKDRCNNEKDS